MTRQKAINEKCKDCIYDPCAPGNWRQQVSGCTHVKCALYTYRPVSKPRPASKEHGNLDTSEADLSEGVR